MCLGTPCPANTYGPVISTSSSAATCTACPAGMNQPLTGQAACVWNTCLAGTFSSTGTASASATSCTPCPSGQYSTTSGATSCQGTMCSANFYGPIGSTSAGGTSCTACAGSSTSPAGASGCTLSCPAGQIPAANSSCAQCPPGQYTTSAGQTQCSGTKCTNGYVGPSGSTSQAAATCTVCGVGQWSIIGDTVCSGSICVAGTYGPSGPQSNANDAACAQCPSGMFSTSQGATSCTLSSDPNTVVAKITVTKNSAGCKLGYFGQLGCTSNACATCTPCPSGTYPDTSSRLFYVHPDRSTAHFGILYGVDTCLWTPCSAGQYGPLGSTTSSAATCTNCAPGTYTASTGLGACTGTPCPAGQFGAAGASSSALATCTSCSPGTFTSTTGQGTCQAGVGGGAVRCRLLWTFGIHIFGAGNVHSLPGRNFLGGWRNGLHRVAVPCWSVRNLRGGKVCRRGSLLPSAVGFIQHIDRHTVQTEPCKYAHRP